MRPHDNANLLLILLVGSISITSSLGRGGAPPHPHGGGSCIPAERAALLAFKKGVTSTTSNGLLASWRGGDCCRWRGVRCSDRTGHVLELRLRNQDQEMINTAQGCKHKNANLLGEISPSLLSLEHLEHLDLSMNCFMEPNGTFPDFLGSMRNLRYLNLSGIPFTGRVPPQLGDLSRIQYLSFGHNGITPKMYSTDITWLAKLSLLQHLSISNVRLSGIADWPQTLNMIPSLRVVSISSCSLDSANQSLRHLNLAKLERLDLSLNNFDHPIGSSWFWKVTSLKCMDLKGNRLFGQLPDALGNMTSLQVLDLSANGNKFFMMKTNMKNLCSLEILDFTNNEMDGDIDVLMEGLPQCAREKLRELRCRNNSFTGNLPSLIGEFTSLNILELSNNKLGGNIPPEIGNLMCLHVLDLSSNNFSGSVPYEIGSLVNLTSLDLSNNNLSGVITEQHFASLKGLQNIDLSRNNLNFTVIDLNWVPPFKLESAFFASCQMGPQFPAWLKQQQLISKLDISRTAIVDEIPDWFWHTFSKATYIDISKNQISGRLPAHLDGMDFEQFNLSSNNLTGAVPTLPRNITVFDISSNAFSGPLPSNLGSPKLKTMIMYSNQIGGNIPESICISQGLVDLDLSSNLLEGEIPQCFQHLSFLLLSSNSLSGAFPAFLQNCKSLAFLDLASNNFSGSIPTWIGELGSLQFLRLSYNAFSGTIPSEVTNLRKLQYLDLSGNNMSGGIPQHLSNLTSMTMKGFRPLFGHSGDHSGGHNAGSAGLGSTDITGQFGEILSIITKGQKLKCGGSLAYFVSIDLSSNSLTGEIPKDITSLDALVNLNLSSNHLGGSIPDKIGDLHALESLDLSKNKLSGEIPWNLSSLTYLSYLNLSYNNLYGRIPSSRQLDTLNMDFREFMYIGNSELCGPPLEKSCSRNDARNHGDGDVRRHKQEFEQMTFFYFGLVLGFVVGLWIVFCALLFNKTLRFAYFRLCDKMCDKICEFVAVNWARSARKEVEGWSSNTIEK